MIDEIRYANYDNDPIKRGHRRYGLFMKRNCYAREKELRATMLRPEEEWETDAAKRGIAVACDLNVLMKAIHVTPASIADASALIAKFKGRRPELIGKPVLVSTFAKPRGLKAAV